MHPNPSLCLLLSTQPSSMPLFVFSLLGYLLRMSQLVPTIWSEIKTINGENEIDFRQQHQQWTYRWLGCILQNLFRQLTITGISNPFLSHILLVMRDILESSGISFRFKQTGTPADWDEDTQKQSNGLLKIEQRKKHKGVGKECVMGLGESLNPTLLSLKKTTFHKNCFA
jgi:hypothetical protein